MNKVDLQYSGRSRNYCGDALNFLNEVEDASISLVVTSPPYNIGKIYERDRPMTLADYDSFLGEVVRSMASKVTQSGSVCWQVGTHVKGGEILPLDYLSYKHFADAGFKLRNRIIWRFNFGLHGQNRFSGRYETLLWFTKSDDYTFNLDPVRVPQRYPGKRHSAKKGDRAGKPSGNPLGKNPSDYWEFNPRTGFLDDPVWEIPNVKANHPEKTAHPCQFPVELAERCVLALSNPDEIVLDPFGGVGSTVVAAEKNGRIGIGVDRDPEYVAVADDRLRRLWDGSLQMRPMGRPVEHPNQASKVASIPQEWLSGEET